MSGQGLSARSLRRNHVRIATSLDRIGSLHQTKQELDEAEKAYAESLELRTRTTGENDPGWLLVCSISPVCIRCWAERTKREPNTSGRWACSKRP